MQEDARLVFTNRSCICKIVTWDVRRGDTVNHFSTEEEAKQYIQNNPADPAVPGEAPVKAENGFTSLRNALTWTRENHLSAAQIEMLIDYAIPETDALVDANTVAAGESGYDSAKNYAISAGDNITITTAPTAAADAAKALRLHYIGSNKNAGAPYAVISRGYTGGSLISVSGGEAAVTNVILDGSKDSYACNGDGGLIHVGSGAMSIQTGATLRNSIAANGGAVYVASGARLNLSGNISFGGTDQDTSGALKGTDGNFVLKALDDSSFKTGTDDPKNGGEAYPKNASDYLVRQDIYIEGYLGTSDYLPATSLYVTGAIANENGANDGSIWVWAEIPTAENENNHYQQLKQFAVFTDGLAEAYRESTLRVFRNAVDDERTQNGLDSYLAGSSEGDLTVPSGSAYTGYVYWSGVSGSRKVILRKVNGVYESLENRSFTIYRGTSSTAYKPKDEIKPLENLVSGASGCFWVGTLPYGTYILEEDMGDNPNKFFYIVIDDAGVFCTLDGEGNDVIDGYPNKEAAQAAAKAKADALKAAKKAPQPAEPEP